MANNTQPTQVSKPSEIELDRLTTQLAKLSPRDKIRMLARLELLVREIEVGKVGE